MPDADLQEQIEKVPSHDEKAESSTVPETEGQPAEGSATEQPEKQEGSAPEKPNKVQERINQLTREKYEAKQKNADLEARLKTLESNAAKPPEPEVKAAPKEDSFEDYSDFQKAQAEYVADRAADVAYQRLSKENQDKDLKAEQQRRQREYQDKKATFDKNLDSKKAHFTDYEKVAYDHDFMDGDLAEQIFDMEKGPEVAYHLGSHLDVAERIFGLPPVQRARELTKLEFQVEALKPKLVSDAPDPITPLGNSEVVSLDPDKMTDAQWLKWRNDTINARNTPAQ